MEQNDAVVKTMNDGGEDQGKSKKEYDKEFVWAQLSHKFIYHVQSPVINLSVLPALQVLHTVETPPPDRVTAHC